MSLSDTKIPEMRWDFLLAELNPLCICGMSRKSDTKVCIGFVSFYNHVMYILGIIVVYWRGCCNYVPLMKVCFHFESSMRVSCVVVLVC